MPQVGESRTANGETRTWSGTGWKLHGSGSGSPSISTPIDPGETDNPYLAGMKGFGQGALEEATPTKLGMLAALLTGGASTGTMMAAAGGAELLAQGGQLLTGSKEAPQSVGGSLGRVALSSGLAGAPAAIGKGLSILTNPTSRALGNSGLNVLKSIPGVGHVTESLRAEIPAAFNALKSAAKGSKTEAFLHNNFGRAAFSGPETMMEAGGKVGGSAASTIGLPDQYTPNVSVRGRAGRAGRDIEQYAPGADPFPPPAPVVDPYMPNVSGGASDWHPEIITDPGAHAASIGRGGKIPYAMPESGPSTGSTGSTGSGLQYSGPGKLTGNKTPSMEDELSGVLEGLRGEPTPGLMKPGRGIESTPPTPHVGRTGTAHQPAATIADESAPISQQDYDDVVSQLREGTSPRGIRGGRENYPDPDAGIDAVPEDLIPDPIAPQSTAPDDLDAALGGLTSEIRPPNRILPRSDELWGPGGVTRDGSLATGKTKANLLVPPEIDTADLRRALKESTDPEMRAHLAKAISQRYQIERTPTTRHP